MSASGRKRKRDERGKLGKPGKQRGSDITKNLCSIIHVWNVPRPLVRDLVSYCYAPRRVTAVRVAGSGKIVLKRLFSTCNELHEAISDSAIVSGQPFTLFCDETLTKRLRPMTPPNQLPTELYVSFGTHLSQEWCRLDRWWPNLSKRCLRTRTGLEELKFDYMLGIRPKGAMPTEIGCLQTLLEMNLCELKITGPLPTAIGLLTNMTRLWLYGCGLTGHLPTEIGNLKQLEYLSLSRNDFCGPIPTEYGRLEELHTLTLGGNDRVNESEQVTDTYLTGTLPTEFGQLSSLTYLRISYTSVEGRIPTEFGALRNLTFLSLCFNKISGRIPSELTKLRKLTLVLDQKRFKRWVESPNPCTFRWVNELPL